MPITVQCECGRRSTVGDPLAGKTIRCPGCGQELYVPAAPVATGGKPKPGKPPKAGPAIHVNSGLITSVSIVGVIVLVIIIFLAGPMRVKHKWDAMEGKAKDNVTDVITFALQAYLSQRGGFNPRSTHMRPHVDDVTFDNGFFNMTMPDKVPFHGKTNQGNFSGTYSVKDGEIAADVEYGGYSFAGMVDIAKAKGSFSMTGRVGGPDNQPSAESGGSKLQIIWPKIEDDQ